MVPLIVIMFDVYLICQQGLKKKRTKISITYYWIPHQYHLHGKNDKIKCKFIKLEQFCIKSLMRTQLFQSLKHLINGTNENATLSELEAFNQWKLIEAKYII